MCVHEHICGFVCMQMYMYGHVLVYLSILLYVMVFCNVESKRRAEDDRQDGAKRVSAGECINVVFTYRCIWYACEVALDALCPILDCVSE